MVTEHFKGCHPDDDRAPETPGHEPQQTEPCWHCGTPTERGVCGCYECWDGADYVPPSAVHHCSTCGRWWAYMTGINITKITFGADEEGTDPVELCIYFDQPGHAPEQKPHPSVYAGDFDKMPMCSRCRITAEGANQ